MEKPVSIWTLSVCSLTARATLAVLLPLLVSLSSCTQYTRRVDARLIGAAGQGRTLTGQVLMAAGGDVDAKNQEGFTALGVAAFGDHIDIMEVLLEAGADVNAKNGLGVTALMVAAAYGHGQTVQLLLKAGAEVNARNTVGVTALAYTDDEEMIELLKKAGARE